jgi:LEA14-like dessication related protein
MHTSTDFCKKTKKLVFILSSLSILALLSISPAVASISDWEFSPQEPVSGDILNIEGSASAGEEVDIFVSFEKTAPVSEGEFEYILEDVKIPPGLNNAFTVEANGADKLNVRVKMGVWVTKSSQASGDKATVSQSSVPPGTYRIKIDGNAKEGVSKVKLKITAFQTIEADSNGKLEYSYNTKAIPSGDFEIKVGGITKKVTIREDESSDSSATGSTSSGTDSRKSASTGPTSTGSTSKNSSTSYNSTNFADEEKESTVKQENFSEKDQGSENTTPDEKTVEEENKTQLSGKNSPNTQSSTKSVDKLYLLAGMGAGLLIVIIYSRRK